MPSKPKSVRAEKNGKYWKAVWYDSNGRRRSKSMGPIASLSARQAKRKADELYESMINTPEARDVCGSETISGWAAVILPIMESELSPNTVVLYQNTLARLGAALSVRRKLSSVTVGDVERWLAAMRAEGLMPATVHGELRRARTLWRRAIDHRVVAANPFSRAQTEAPTSSGPKRLLTNDEILRLVDASPTPGWANMIALCGLAGLRRGEALILTWDAIRWGESRIVVTQPKTARHNGSTRVARMEPELESILLRTRDEIDGATLTPHCRSNAKRIMFGGEFHRKLPGGRMSTVKYSGVVDRAGVDGFTAKALQTLRSSRASIWRQQYPEHVVDAWMGHSLEVARRHYVTVDDRYYSDVSELERLRAENERLRSLKSPKSAPKSSSE